MFLPPDNEPPTSWSSTSPTPRNSPTRPRRHTACRCRRQLPRRTCTSRTSSAAARRRVLRHRRQGDFATPQNVNAVKSIWTGSVRTDRHSELRRAQQQPGRVADFTTAGSDDHGAERDHGVRSRGRHEEVTTAWCRLPVSRRCRPAASRSPASSRASHRRLQGQEHGRGVEFINFMTQRAEAASASTRPTARCR